VVGDAFPVALLTRMRGGFFDISVTVAVPLGLWLGTHDWRSLAPAAVIVAAMVTRSRLRQQSRARTALMDHRGATIVDQPSPHTGSPE
jgi:predicted MFS family arabinose efflux permease